MSLWVSVYTEKIHMTSGIHIPWYTTRERCITILYHTIENTVTITINAAYEWHMMGRLDAIMSIIIWLAPWAGTMNQILCCDWLSKRARWSYLARSGLPAVSRKRNFSESHIINPLLTKLVRSRWLDIVLVLFLRVYGPRLRLGPWTRKKKNLANIQPSWPHTWSITHTYTTAFQLLCQSVLLCVNQENTSDKWDIWWYTTGERYITILYHAIENKVANTIKATYAPHMMGRLDVMMSSIQPLSCILTGCIFHGMV